MRTGRNISHSSHSARAMAFVAFGAVVLGACGGDELSERAVEEAAEQAIEGEGGDVDVEFDEDGAGQIQIEGSDGEAVEMQFDEGGGVDLPEGFPSEVPLPDGLNIQQVSSFDDAQGATFLIAGTVDDEPGPAVEAYIEALSAAGYEQRSMTQTPEGAFFDYADETWNVSGGSTPDAVNGNTTFTLTVFPAVAG
jgi:major membrane immunogen (membrane-anchored lipoprotein)